MEENSFRSNCRIHGPFSLSSPVGAGESFPQINGNVITDCGNHVHWHHCPELHRAFNGVQYIADYAKREEDSNKVYFYSLNEIVFGLSNYVKA